MPTPGALTVGGRERLARPPAVIGAFVAAAIVLGALYLAGPYLPGSLSDAAFWNLNSERGLGTWYSAMQIALIGVLFLGFAALRFRESKRSTVVFGIAGLGALFLSLDEQARLHERFARYIDSTTFGSDLGLDRSGPWMLVVAPAFLAAFALLASLARRDLRGRPLVGWLFLAGTLLFAAAFAGVEVLRNFTSFGTALDRVMTVCEEGGEMLGATLSCGARTSCSAPTETGPRILPAPRCRGERTRRSAWRGVNSISRRESSTTCARTHSNSTAGMPILGSAKRASGSPRGWTGWLGVRAQNVRNRRPTSGGRQTRRRCPGA